MWPAILVIAGSVLLLGIVLLGWWRWRHRRADDGLARACDTFHLRREWLEARFVSLAGRSGRPRGLEWSNCDFDNGVAFARDRQTGELRALVGVTIRFRAVENGGMEDVEAVGNLRAATAVFRHDGSQWETDGRAVFNLNPTQTIKHFGHELETVDLAAAAAHQASGPAARARRPHR